MACKVYARYPTSTGFSPRNLRSATSVCRDHWTWCAPALHRPNDGPMTDAVGVPCKVHLGYARWRVALCGAFYHPSNQRYKFHALEPASECHHRKVWPPICAIAAVASIRHTQESLWTASWESAGMLVMGRKDSAIRSGCLRQKSHTYDFSQRARRPDLRRGCGLCMSECRGPSSSCLGSLGLP